MGKKMQNAKRAIANVVYGMGVIAVIVLGLTALFGSREIVFPQAMIPFTWREEAFALLAWGSVPMLLACMAAYRFNGVAERARKRRDFVLVFLPGLVCAACALFVIVVVLLGIMVFPFFR